MKSLKKIGIISAIIVIVGVLSTLSQVFAVDYNEELANCDMEIGKLEDILATCNEKQNQAHNMAEAARALEFAEDDVVIQKAQEVWYDAEESKQNLTVSLDELYAHRVDLEAKVEILPKTIISMTLT